MAKEKQTNQSDINLLDISGVFTPETISFHIKGISPLLQNNPQSMGGSEDSGLQAKKEYNDQEETTKRLYEIDGNYCHPAEAFIKAIIRAVTGKKFGKAAAPGVIRSGVFVVDPYFPILTADYKPSKDYAIDKRSVVVQKNRILRCRPRWDAWTMKVSFQINSRVIGIDQVKSGLALAGVTVGVGDYRPEKSGGYGRFLVEG